MSGYIASINTAIATGEHVIHSWIEITKPDGTKEAWGFYPKESDVGNHCCPKQPKLGGRLLDMTRLLDGL